MQKNAWIYSMTAMIMGAVGVLVRWLQCEIIFEEETGLPIRNAGASFLLVAVLAVFVAVLWWLSGKMGAERSPEEPTEALAKPNWEVQGLLIFSAIIAGGGALLMFFTETDTMMRITALVGLLSVVTLACMLMLPHWGAFGCFVSVLPVLFFSLWLVFFYKDNSKNPVLWQYCMQTLAIVGCLLASFRMSSYVFYRAKPRKCIYACALALTISLTVLMDNASAAARLLFAGWGIGYGVMSWVLIHNFLPPDIPEEDY